MTLSRSTTKRLIAAATRVRNYSAPAERSIPAAKQKYVPTSGKYPKGFLAGSSHAGVKASNTSHDDIALVVSEQLCVASAVFTRNFFQAAPVSVSKRILNRHNQRNIRGVVVNSGCANAVTGSLGYHNAMEMGHTADRCFNSDASSEETNATDGSTTTAVDESTPSKGGKAQKIPQTLVMSTGVIGQPLPIEKIKQAIPKAHTSLGSTHEHWLSAARAICTTDTFPKLITQSFNLPSHPETEYRFAGMTKGAGMIHPNMGTLLGIICTDAKLDPLTSYNTLRLASNGSFNSISIDGDTSTNDTVALLSNGAAASQGVAPLEFPIIPDGRVSWTEDAKAFDRALKQFMIDLAKLVVRDGEGATKFVTVRVQSDVSRSIAHSVAKSIATSSLVKTALYGQDANWGRILCAVGYAPGIMPDPRLGTASASVQNSDEKDARPKPPISQRRTSVAFVPSDGSEALQLLVRGEPQHVDEARAKEILELEDLEILVRLQDDEFEPELGAPRTHEAVVWTCDFSHEYVTINGDYRT